MKSSKLIAILLAIALIAGTFIGCTPTASQTEDPASPTDTTDTATPDEEPGTPDEEPEGSALSVKYAKNFAIDYLADGVKLITLPDGKQFLLVPNGVAAPDGYDGATQVTTPISRGVYLSTNYVSFVGVFKDDSLFESVVGVGTDEYEWTTPQILDRFAAGTVKYIPQNSDYSYNAEEVISLAPDFVFIAGGGMDGPTSLSLSEVGVANAELMDWQEADIPANLEWLKFFGAFYNLDEEADAIVEAQLASLEELKAKVAEIGDDSRPLVAYGLVYDGVVYTQGADSTFAEAIYNAGGKYALDVPGDGSVTITMEEFLDKARNADIIIYGTQPQYLSSPDKAGLLEIDPLFAEFDAFKNDSIYIFSKGYYMNAALVLEKFQDQVFLFQPELLPDHSLIFYEKLG
jgi:iron complex transport system substrate-binding protein